jgi:hypothetical protein
MQVRGRTWCADCTTDLPFTANGGIVGYSRHPSEVLCCLWIREGCLLRESNHAYVGLGEKVTRRDGLGTTVQATYERAHG